MPEAIKETTSEVAAPPQIAAEDVADVAVDVKPTEASSGTLPAGEVPVRADGNGEAAAEGEVAPVSADPIPEEGKSEEAPQPDSSAEAEPQDKAESNETDKDLKDPPTGDNPDSGVSSTKEDTPLDKEALIDQYVKEGSGAIIERDFYTASEAFSKACELSSEVFGDVAERNAELYFMYGCALLETGKAENTVLGENVKENDEEDDEEEDDNEEAMETEEKASNGEAVDEKDTDVKEAAEGKVDSEKSDEKPDNGEITEENPEVEEKVNGSAKSEMNGASSSKAVNGAEEGESTEEVKEEEDTPLKVAWEMLELAKLCFEKQNNDKRIADTMMKLGEVGIESGHPTAMDDMKKALELRQKVYPAEHRIIPETHFNIGLAYSAFQLFDDAIIHFETAKSLLQARVVKLSSDTGKSAEDEAQEIRDLIPELDEKIADMKDSKKDQTMKIKAELEKEAGGSRSADAPKDITHLVKRKRTLEDVVTEKAPKQPCTEDNDKKVDA